jgi:hypothetical protein
MSWKKSWWCIDKVDISWCFALRVGNHPFDRIYPIAYYPRRILETRSFKRFSALTNKEAPLEINWRLPDGVPCFCLLLSCTLCPLPLSSSMVSTI